MDYCVSIVGKKQYLTVYVDNCQTNQEAIEFALKSRLDRPDELVSMFFMTVYVVCRCKDDHHYACKVAKRDKHSRPLTIPESFLVRFIAEHKKEIKDTVSFSSVMKKLTPNQTNVYMHRMRILYPLMVESPYWDDWRYRDELRNMPMHTVGVNSVRKNIIDGIARFGFPEDVADIDNLSPEWNKKIENVKTVMKRLSVSEIELMRILNPHRTRQLEIQTKWIGPHVKRWLRMFEAALRPLHIELVLHIVETVYNLRIRMN